MLNVIISHDVDHLTPWEHKKDLIVPKFILRAIIEYSTGHISFKEFYLRWKSLFNNKWQNLQELMDFDKSNQIPSTFFVALNSGSGLSYDQKQAKHWIEKIIQNGFDIGVHGIEYRNFSKIKRELDVFKGITGMSEIGIRIHYMKMEDYTLGLLQDAGYMFDSSIYGLKDCFRYNKIWEFPLHIMDRMVIFFKRKWLSEPWDKIVKRTYSIIDLATEENIRYLTVLFHDYYFNDMFSTWKRWYEDLIEYLKNREARFLDYKTAIRELEGMRT